MRTGINTYTYRWSLAAGGGPGAGGLDIFGLLDAAVAHDVQIVQICDNYPLDQKPESEWRAIAAQAKDQGLILETGTRGTEPERLKQYLDISKIMGSKLLRAMVSPQPSPEQKNQALASTVRDYGRRPENSKPDIPSVISELKSVAPLFEDAGVTLALENYEVLTAGELAEVVEGVGSSAVGVCLDTTNNLGTTETPEAVARILAPYAKNFHLKDYTIRRLPHMGGFIIEGCPLGKGILNLDSIFDLLKQQGALPDTIIELWTPTMEQPEQTLALEREWAEESVRYFKHSALNTNPVSAPLDTP